jgi:hypothetical protein
MRQLRHFGIIVDNNSRNSQIYLNPTPYKNNNSGKPVMGLYTQPDTHPQKIFINRLPITGKARGDINMISQLIGHEEIHQAINKAIDYPTTRAYDKISRKVDKYPSLNTTSIPPQDIRDEQ